MLKRVLDIMGSALLLVLFAPVMLITALLILIDLGRPVFFIQVRPGLNEKRFSMIKFRTMRNTDDQFSTDADRLSKLGAVLRRFSLDELPELINVLRGEMSLVGPRPLLEEYLPLYSKKQMRRHEVRPGITGRAQIKGRNAISWEEKFDLDVWYVDHQSIWLDLQILIVTLIKFLRTSDINQPGHATAEKFVGTKH